MHNFSMILYDKIKLFISNVLMLYNLIEIMIIIEN